MISQRVERECTSTHLGSLARPTVLREELPDVLRCDVSILPTASLDSREHARQRRMTKHDVLTTEQRHALELMRVLNTKPSRRRMTITNSVLESSLMKSASP